VLKRKRKGKIKERREELNPQPSRLYLSLFQSLKQVTKKKREREIKERREELNLQPSTPLSLYSSIFKATNVLPGPPLFKKKRRKIRKKDKGKKGRT
jgi:hypothetical protein